MKKSLIVIVMMFMVPFGFAQESKPKIGLVDVKVVPKDNPEAVEAAARLDSFLSEALVKTKRFAVMTRNSSDIDSLIDENLSQVGTLPALKGLDFLLTAKLVEFKKDVEEVKVLMLGSSKQEILSFAVELKFIDVVNGRLIIQENISEVFKGAKATSTLFGSGKKKEGNLVTQAMEEFSNTLAVKITETIYPTQVLSVSDEGVITIPNIGFAEGEILNVYSLGEKIIDPYTKKMIGREEKFIAPIVIFEVSSVTAKAVIPRGGKYNKFKKVKVEKSMICKRTNTSITPQELKSIKKQKQ